MMTMTMMVMMMVRDGDEKKLKTIQEFGKLACEVMALPHHPSTNSPQSPRSVLLVERLSKDNGDGDGNENGNKAIGLY